MSITIRLGVALTIAGALVSPPFSFAQGVVKTYGFGTAVGEQELVNFYSSLPDGRGLPDGKGTADSGKQLYAEKCASCHGDQLQGGLGDRLVGGRGTLVNNDSTKKPIKTIESYWPYATTVWDYIKRAMPFDAPGSLTNDEVYSLCAYILAEAHVVEPNVVLDKASLSKVRMPNRDGFAPDPRPEKFGDRSARAPKP
jgi:cytochrome c